MSLKDKIKDLKTKNKINKPQRTNNVFSEETIFELIKISEEQDISFFNAVLFFCDDRDIDEEYFFEKCDDKIKSKLKESALNENLIPQKNRDKSVQQLFGK